MKPSFFKKMLTPRVVFKRSLTASLVVLVLLVVVVAWAIVIDLRLVALLHIPQAEHADQQEFYDLVANGQKHEAFEAAFEDGDELFKTVFNALDGVGANVGQGQRFTRVPRADLTGVGEWANHVPKRTTGPNASSCNGCHNQPSDDGAGGISGNVHRDPTHSGVLSKFIQRNTPHLFGAGAIQRLAEEVTARLQSIREDAKNAACSTGVAVTKELRANGVNFGFITATPIVANPCQVTFDTSLVIGTDADLVIKPFQWKGAVASVRDFNRGDAHNELGIQPVEIAGDNVDGDFDGVQNEITVGDMTALAISVAAQPRPTTKLELNSLGLETLTPDQIAQINRGADKFKKIKCSSCHTPTMTLDDPTFSEPSQSPDYRDAIFPAGQDPISRKVDPAFAVTFDLTMDQPDNVIRDAAGQIVFRLGSLKKARKGALVELYGDLKRHDLGPDLAESIDETGTGAATFLTENLWGVGSTAPYLHDGRATTLTEAILEHGGEAAAARTAFRVLDTSAQADVIKFLESLVLFKIKEDDD